MTRFDDCNGADKGQRLQIAPVLITPVGGFGGSICRDLPCQTWIRDISKVFQAKTHLTPQFTGETILTRSHRQASKMAPLASLGAELGFRVGLDREGRTKPLNGLIELPLVVTGVVLVGHG